jgi:hypothetical protein
MAGPNYAQPSRTHFKPYIRRFSRKAYHKVGAGDENTMCIFGDHPGFILMVREYQLFNL